MILLFDGNVCFLLIAHDEVDFSGVVGNDEQLFAFCLAVIYGFIKN